MYDQGSNRRLCVRVCMSKGGRWWLCVSECMSKGGIIRAGLNRLNKINNSTYLVLFLSFTWQVKSS